VAAGRGLALEAALHVAVLVATEPLDGGDAGPGPGADRRIMSGNVLWLLGGAVANAMAAEGFDPFAAWAELLACGLWPVGPSGGRLVVARRWP